MLLSISTSRITYHLSTSPGFGFSTRTTLSQFKRQSGSKASLSWRSSISISIIYGRGKWGTYLSHRIHSRLSKFVVQVVPLHKPHAMLSRNRSLHGNGPLDHTVNELLCLFPLFIVVEHYSYILVLAEDPGGGDRGCGALTVKVPISYMANDRRE